MASQGPLLAGAGADDAGVGTVAWTSPGSITADDSVRATRVLTQNVTSHYLKSSAHGFAIPAGATINGIVVEIDRSQSGTSPVRDNQVRIVKADGTVGATNQADTVNNWPTTPDVTVSYGSASDLWGETWTPADINDPDFGAAIAARNSGATSSTARVDFIRITVYYTADPVDSGAVSSVAVLSGDEAVVDAGAITSIAALGAVEASSEVGAVTSQAQLAGAEATRDVGAITSTASLAAVEALGELGQLVSVAVLAGDEQIAGGDVVAAGTVTSIAVLAGLEALRADGQLVSVAALSGAGALGEAGIVSSSAVVAGLEALGEDGLIVTIAVLEGDGVVPHVVPHFGPTPPAHGIGRVRVRAGGRGSVRG